MKIENAISKLKKAGFTIIEDKKRYTASYQNNDSYIVFFEQDGKMICLHIEYRSNPTDSQIDLFPGIWNISSMKSAIRLAIER